MQKLNNLNTIPDILAKTGDLYVSNAGGKGRSIFAGKAFKKGQVIERSCVIEISRSEHFQWE